MNLAKYLIPFCNEFNHFYNTGRQMLYSVYRMTLNVFHNPFLVV